MRKQVLAVTIGVLLVLSVFSVLRLWQIKPAYAAISTFGNTAIGAYDDYEDGNKIFGSLETCSNSGIATNISAYIRSFSANTNATCAMYKHSDLSLVAVSNEIHPTTNYQWNNFTIAASVSPQDYLLEIWGDGAIGYYFDYPTANGGHQQMLAYGSFPDPLVPTHGLRNNSIYVTYTIQSPPTFSTIAANTTVAGFDFQLSCLVNSATNVSAYIHSHNNTGTVANETTTMFSSFYNTTAAWANMTGTWNETIGNTVSVKIYANNTEDEWSSSAWTYFTLSANWAWYDYTFNLTDVDSGALTQKAVDTEYDYIGIPNELRGVFIHEATYGVTHNWTLIAETLEGYNITDVFVNDQSGLGRRPDAEISAAITAFHANGIEYHSSMNVLAETAGYGNAYCAIKSDGTIYSVWVQCPILAHDQIVTDLQDYLLTFNVDGLMLDYIRYDVSDMCYCSQCRAAFEQWLGEGTITNWTQFYPDQARWLDYAEWRTIPITTLVKDMRTAALAINPNLKLSEAAWTYFSNTPTYWRKYIGQDTGKWIKEGYIDFVAPMMYTGTIYGTSGETLESEINANLQYMTAGPQGKIPLMALLASSTGINLTQFEAEVEYVRSRGLDGWILWRYSGPGGYLPSTPNMTDYLAVLDLPQILQISNVTVSAQANTATISWTTDVSATSKVEYNTSQLFTSKFELTGDFYSWNAKHVNGTWATNNTAVTSHLITLTGLQTETQYNFRVQSLNAYYNATSPAFNFTTGSDISWKLYNASQLLSYTEEQSTLRNGTYTLKSYFHEYLINETTINTDLVPSGTITVKLPLKGHSSVENGYVGANTTITSSTFYSQTSANLTFALVAGTPAQIIIDVPKNATSIKKDGTPLMVWEYNSLSKFIQFNVTSFSNFELLFEGGVGGTTFIIVNVWWGFYW